MLIPEKPPNFESTSYPEKKENTPEKKQKSLVPTKAEVDSGYIKLNTKERAFAAIVAVAVGILFLPFAGFVGSLLHDHLVMHLASKKPDDTSKREASLGFNPANRESIELTTLSSTPLERTSTIVNKVAKPIQPKINEIKQEKSLEEKHASIKEFILQPEFGSASNQLEYKKLQKEAATDFKTNVSKELKLSLVSEESTYETNLNEKRNEPLTKLIDKKFEDNQTIKEKITELRKLSAENPEKDVQENIKQLEEKYNAILVTLNEVNKNSLSEEGQKSFDSDLEKLSKAAGLIKNEVNFRQEIKVLSQPEKVAARELANIKAVLLSATENDHKIVHENGRFVTKERSFVGSEKSSGTSPEAYNTVKQILNKLSLHSGKTELKGDLEEILKLLNKNDWVTSVLKNNVGKGILLDRKQIIEKNINPRTPLEESHDEIQSFLIKNGSQSENAKAELEKFQNKSDSIIKQNVDDVTNITQYENEVSGEGGKKYPESSESPKVTLARVNEEVKALKISVGNDPKLTDYVKKLEKTLAFLGDSTVEISETEKNVLSARLLQISDTVKLIESEIIHQEDAKAIQKQITLQELTNIQNAFTNANKAEAGKENLVINQIVLVTKDGSTHAEILKNSDNANDSTRAILTFLENLKFANDPDYNTIVQKTLSLLATNKSGAIALRESITLVTSVNDIQNRPTPQAISLSDRLNTISIDPKKPSFQKAVLLTYRNFAADLPKADKELSDSANFLNFISNEFKKFDTSFKTKLQLLKLVEQWVSDPTYNNHELELENPQASQLKEQITRFLEEVKKENSPSINAVAARLGQLLNPNETDPLQKEVTSNNLSEIEKENVEAVENKKSDPPSVIIQNIANGTTRPGSTEYDEAVNVFAQNLTAYSGEYFKAINSSEFKNGEWVKDDLAPIQSPNISKNAKIFNDLSNFIIKSIVNPTDSIKGELDVTQQKAALEQSKRMVQFYISVQAKLISEKNEILDLNSTTIIQSALDNASVDRLKLNENLSSKLQKTTDKVKNLFDRDKNSLNIRQAMVNSSKPVLPFIGLFLSDMTFINDGNSTVNKVDGSINHEKIAMFGTTVNSINLFQQDIKLPSKTFGEIPSYSKIEKEDIYQKSLLIKPTNINN